MYQDACHVPPLLCSQLLPAHIGQMTSQSIVGVRPRRTQVPPGTGEQREWRVGRPYALTPQQVTELRQLLATLAQDNTLVDQG